MTQSYVTYLFMLSCDITHGLVAPTVLDYCMCVCLQVRVAQVRGALLCDMSHVTHEAA